MSTETPTCAKTIYGGGMFGRARPCGRALRTDAARAAGLCGPHLAGQKRADAAAVDRQERLEQYAAIQQRAEQVVALLRDHGIRARVQGGYETPATVELDIHHAEKLVALLSPTPTPKES